MTDETTSPWAPVPDPSGSAPAGPLLDLPAPAPVPEGRPHPRRRVALAISVVLALVAGGFGIAALTAADGPQSADAAVQAMFDAIDQEDVIGVLESLDPGERDLLRPTIDDTSSQAKRVKVASSDLDLRKVAGLDVRVSDLTMTVVPLRDGISAVDISRGTVTSAADLDQLPLGPVIKDIIRRDESSNDGPSNHRKKGTIDLHGSRLVATRSAGSWHVSVLYSIAENIRRSGDPVRAFPADGTAIPATGAPSPEAAVREAIDAATHQDVRRLIELTPADEMAVLHDYGPILVAGAKDADRSNPPKIEKLELRTEDGADGRKVVRATALDLQTGTPDTDGAYRVTYDGRCTTSSWTWLDEYANVDDNGDPIPDPNAKPITNTTKVCDDDQTRVGPQVLFGFLGLTGPVGRLRVVTEEHDGRWFVSPVGTIFDSATGLLDGLTADDAVRSARAWSGEYWLYEPASFWDACKVDAPTLDTSRKDAAQIYERCIEALPDTYQGEGYGSGAFRAIGREGSGAISSSPSASSTADRCYQKEGSTAILACLRAGVADGTIPPDEGAMAECELTSYAPLDAVDEPTDAQFEAADKAFDACRDSHGASSGGGSVTYGGSGSPGSSGVAPSQTTVVAGQDSNETVPPASTSVPATAAPSTTVAD